MVELFKSFHQCWVCMRFLNGLIIGYNQKHPCINSNYFSPVHVKAISNFEFFIMKWIIFLLTIIGTNDVSELDKTLTNIYTSTHLHLHLHRLALGKVPF